MNDGTLEVNPEVQTPCFRPYVQVTSHAGGVSAALGPNIFTDIAFEAGVGVYGVDAFKVRTTLPITTRPSAQYYTRFDCTEAYTS